MSPSTITETRPSGHQVGERVELARYRISAGERVIYGQRIDGARHRSSRVRPGPVIPRRARARAGRQLRSESPRPGLSRSGERPRRGADAAIACQQSFIALDGSPRCAGSECRFGPEGPTERFLGRVEAAVCPFRPPSAFHLMQ
jgi:hypothetical protein